MSAIPRPNRTAADPAVSWVPFMAAVPVELHVPADADGSVLVALHGMGQSAASFAREAVPCAPPRTAVLLPQGPYPFEMRRDAPSHGGTPGAAGQRPEGERTSHSPGSPGSQGHGAAGPKPAPSPAAPPAPPRQGNAWYVWTGDSDAFRAAMEHVEAWLLSVVLSQIGAAGLDPRRVSLLGFSQGGYLAGFVGVRNPDRFRSLVVASGRIKDEFLATAAPRAAAAGLRVLHAHGTRDEAVRPEPCRASLERLASWGVATEFRTFDAGHAVLRDATCRDAVREFLADGGSTS